MLGIFAILLQDPTQTTDPTGGVGGFNWADYGPLGIMAFGLLTAVVVLWRKNERLEGESKAQAEKVLTVLIEVQRVLPDVLTTIKEARQGSQDITPALERIDQKMASLEKVVKSFAKSASKGRTGR